MEFLADGLGVDLEVLGDLDGRQPGVVEPGSLLDVLVGELSAVWSAFDAVPVQMSDNCDRIDLELRHELSEGGPIEVGSDELEDLVLAQPVLPLERPGASNRARWLTRRRHLDPRSPRDQGFQGWREVTEPRGKDHGISAGQRAYWHLPEGQLQPDCYRCVCNSWPEPPTPMLAATIRVTDRPCDDKDSDGEAERWRLAEPLP